MVNRERVGKWITDDGQVATPDPSNLYRYVGNNPTNAIDPSGLDSEFASKKQLNLDLPGFTLREMTTLSLDFKLAVQRVDKAYNMLKYHWPELKELSTFIPAPGRKPFLSARYRKLASDSEWVRSRPDGSEYRKLTNREVYLADMERVLDRLRDIDHETKMKPDRSPPTKNGREAYVIYTLGTPGSTIYITDLFWKVSEDRQVDDLVHELARLIGFDEENTGRVGKDVYDWDNTITFLADKYDELMSKKK